MDQLLPHISIVICTRNRADSLAITLESLASANREGLRVEVIVADNASQDRTKEVAESFGRRIPVRYCYVPTLGVYGKSHALNHVLDFGGLGELIAVLDDDITVDLAWFQGVIAISRRWPDKDIFAGDTHTIWPEGDVPGWARNPELQSWIFSSVRVTRPDSPLQEGRWFSGNHWWFRSRVLASGTRFKDIWLTEPAFQLDLTELGFRGTAGKDAVAGHRIQRALFQRDAVLVRAKKTGREAASVLLNPYRQTVKQARLLAKHPWLGRLYCLGNYFRWRIWHLLSYCYPSNESRFAHRLMAAHQLTMYLELLRSTNRLAGYRLLKRARSQAVPETAP
jgi:glycosyltransferase involved in cell wall biosynthesis